MLIVLELRENSCPISFGDKPTPSRMRTSFSLGEMEESANQFSCAVAIFIRLETTAEEKELFPRAERRLFSKTSVESSLEIIFCAPSSRHFEIVKKSKLLRTSTNSQFWGGVRNAR